TSTRVLIGVFALVAIAAFVLGRQRATPRGSSATGAFPTGARSPSGGSMSPTPAGAPPETAEALGRVYTELMAAAQSCPAAPLPRDADPEQHARMRVTTEGNHVQSMTRLDGELAPSLAACINERWRAARWHTTESDPHTLTLDLNLDLRQLR